MSLFWRPRPAGTAVRAAAMGQQYTGDGSEWAASYTEVDPTVGETALQSVAVGAAVELITSLVSELPVDVFSGAGRDRRPRPTPGYLLDPSGDGYGLEDWVAQALISWLLRGNLFGDVLARGPGGYPTQVVWFHPDGVAGWLDGDGVPQWNVYGRPVVNLADFWHRRVNPVPGRVLGLSPIASRAAAIGLNITGAQFGLRWFRDGAHPSGILSNAEDPMTDKGLVQEVKRRFMAAVRGNREPIVLGRGWAFSQVQINPEESQFLETQKFTAAECARIFGPGMAEILGYETGGSLTYVTVEGKSVHLSVYTLHKWLRRVERLLTAMLPRPQYARINRAALLETTTMERYQAYALALAGRWKTVNEVRDKEDEGPVPWGDAPTTAPAPQSAPDQVPAGQ